MRVGGQVDAWKIDEVRQYLARVFPAARLDDYPRGLAIAHLFVVTATGIDRRKQERHYLLVTRQFFDRFSDGAGLKDALDSADVPRSLARAGERTVELY
ncbi:MAG TPA: hypothetical protein VGW35_18485 [Methylomirabilota bacterium]|nr:hypothetical protein [Methylomirabilota bacterium]